MSLSKTDPLKTSVSNEAIRKLAFPILVLMPFVSWGFGKTAAANILSGRAYSEARAPFEVLERNGVSARQSLRYLGSTKDYTLLMISADASIWIIRNEELPGIRLVRRRFGSEGPLIGNY